MKKLLFLLILMILPMLALADAVEVNGIYYNLNTESQGAQLVSHPNKYTGTIIIPESFEYNGVKYTVNTISKAAFSGCTGLNSVTIPSSVSVLPDYMFKDCSNLNSVTIPDVVTKIGIGAFEYCIGLTSIELPSNLTYLGVAAFEGCTNLSSISLPSGVTLIYDRCFYNCNSLESCTMGDDVTMIATYAFAGCASLKKLVIPDKIMTISIGAFYGCRDLTDFYCGASKIPDTFFNAFEDAYICYATLHVPESSISDYKSSMPWSEFGKIVDLNTGDSGSGSTSNVDGILVGGIYFNILGKANIAEVSTNPTKYSGVISIPESIEYNDIIYPVSSIGATAFKDCKNLSSITIPVSVQNIASAAFSGCTSLTTMTLPNSLRTISQAAFSGCTGLTNVTIPSSVSVLPDYLFKDCSSLNSVTIPDVVTKIGIGAFEYCIGLTSIELPSNLTYLGVAAFEGCTNLSSISLPSGVTLIYDRCFYNCNSLESCTMGDDVTMIATYAFAGCASLKKLVIPDKIMTISIGAFNGCTSLTDFYCVALKMPNTSVDAFDTSNINNATLHVHGNIIDNFKTNTPWNNFANIIPITTSDNVGVIRMDDSNLKLNPDIDDFTYSGEAIEYNIQVVYNNTSLTEGTDYNISYQQGGKYSYEPYKDIEGKPIDAGYYYKLIVTLKNGYSGSLEKKYSISPRDITNIMSIDEINDQPYTGKRIEPEIIVRLDNKVLDPSNYIVSYTNNLRPGTARINVKAIGNYKGETETTFTINPASDVVSIKVTDETNKHAEVVQILSNESIINIPTSVDGYIITSIAANVFLGKTYVTDIYLPETEIPISLGENALKISDDIIATVHTPLSLLDDYALNIELKQNFEASKVVSSVKVPNKYWSFSCGVDVVLPVGMIMYKCRINDEGTGVLIYQIDDSQLLIDGKQVLKANNGVLIACPDDVISYTYEVAAHSGNQTSGTTPATTDAKSYGDDNMLVPVIESTNYNAGGFYVLKNNEFHAIIANDSKVPACKAVLRKSTNAVTTRSLGIIDGEGTTSISHIYIRDDDSEWYSIRGQRIEHPNTKGIYINNGRKVIVK